MKVLLVCNNAYNKGNGLSVAVLNTLERLKSAGIDARLMAVRNPDPSGPQPDFPLEHFIFPLFEPVIRANGFCYAKIDRKRISEAIDWADVVHLEEAFPLEDYAVRIAAAKGKARVGSFHIFPQNITANLDLGGIKPLSNAIMSLWNHSVYNKCSDIHCPTSTVSKYMEDHGTKARLHVISNGIDIPAEPVVTTPLSPEGTIDILCIGRLSNEKSQLTLLNAMKYSKYAHRIHITFAGKGPKETKYRRAAEKLLGKGVLKHRPDFGFFSHDELGELSRKSYLYVHCAWVEVEGLSCLEAMHYGAVPVIAKNGLTGSASFALQAENLFPAHDSRALAQRIDWWIEHPEERNKASQASADFARRFNIENSTSALIRMYEKAIESNHA